MASVSTTDTYIKGNKHLPLSITETIFPSLKVHTPHYMYVTDITYFLIYEGLMCCLCGYLVSGSSGRLESDVGICFFVIRVGTTTSSSLWWFVSSISICWLPGCWWAPLTLDWVSVGALGLSSNVGQRLCIWSYMSSDHLSIRHFHMHWNRTWLFFLSTTPGIHFPGDPFPRGIDDTNKDQIFLHDHSRLWWWSYFSSLPIFAHAQL